MTVNQCCCGFFKAAQTTKLSDRRNPSLDRVTFVTVNQCCCGFFKAAQTTKLSDRRNPSLDRVTFYICLFFYFCIAFGKLHTLSYIQ